MSKKTRILLITERRADYSRFKPLLKLMKDDLKIDYKIIVTGSHLLKSHGYTINEIKKDKFKIFKKIKNFQNLRKK
jgi:GDP/UDP-N,N'-diacetylbacillosamine 2-epimerase (hydrolysing)